MTWMAARPKGYSIGSGMRLESAVWNLAKTDEHVVAFKCYDLKLLGHYTTLDNPPPTRARTDQKPPGSGEFSGDDPHARGRRLYIS